MGCTEPVRDAAKPWKLWCGKPATEIRVVNGKRDTMCPQHAAIHDKKVRRGSK